MLFYKKYPVINKYRSSTPKGFYDPVKGHTGVDYNTPEGTPLSFPVSLECSEIEKFQQMGWTMFLNTPSGEIIVLSHLSEIRFNVGDKIPPNTVVALSGNTGTATTGPHLHLEVIASKPEKGGEVMQRALGSKKGFNIDPVAFLDRLEPYEGSEGLKWAYTHQIILHASHEPKDTFTKEETCIMLKRLAKQIINWTKDEKS